MGYVVQLNKIFLCTCIATSCDNNVLYLFFCPCGYRITIEYGEGYSANDGGTDWPNKGVCELKYGEYITKLETNTVEKMPFNYKAISGITIVTNQKSCGHFGMARRFGKLFILQGHKLLYMTGSYGMYYDRFDLYFDYC